MNLQSKQISRETEPSPSSWFGTLLGSSTFRGAGVIVLLTFLSYWPTLQAGFIWDDDKMLTSNPLVRLPLGLYYIWCSTALPDYFPLTSTSFWLEWRLWGEHPAGYHLTNLLLHAASAVLLWKVLQRLRIPGAWLAALLFAVHPINVQSVAWIAERKNTLCMFFFLLSLLWYLRSQSKEVGLNAQRPQTSNPQPSTLNPQRLYYWLSLGAFLCALLSKTAVVMGPFVLLLCHWWLQSRAGSGGAAGPTAPKSSPERLGAGPGQLPSTLLSPRLLLRLAPFFALSLVLGLVTLWFQSHRAIAGDLIRNDDFLTRLAGAGRAVWFYAGKTLAPLDLCFVYPQWQIDEHSFALWLPLGAIILTLAVLMCFRRSWGRGPLFGFGYFLLMLLPILGLVNIYFQRYSLVGDHWTYFASPGIIVVVVGGGAYFLSRHKNAWVLPVAAVAAVAWLIPATQRQARVYHDLGTLWEDTLAKNPTCWLAHNSLGSALADAGRFDEARHHLEQALAAKPDSMELLNNLASVFLDQGKPDEAMAYLRKALEIAPGSALAYYNLGNAYDQLNQPERAEANYRRALELDPAHAETHGNLGCLLYAAGKKHEAIDEFTRAISLKPDYAEALNNLAVLFLELKRAPEAESLLREAIRSKPAYADAHFNLGNALLSQGWQEEAATAYRRALALAPQNPLAHCRLGTALWQGGAAQPALDELEAALRLQPNLAEAHYQIGLILATQKQPAGAVTRLREALRLRPEWPEAMAGLALTLASASSESDRNPSEALRVASRAVELTANTNAVALDAFAAACAATGKFEEATRTATKAAELARAAGDPKRAEEFQARRKLYAANQPYRQ
jgi:protein O-mannosyl-transferase